MTRELKDGDSFGRYDVVDGVPYGSRSDLYAGHDVYCGRDRYLGDLVSLLVPRSQFQRDVEWRRRFEREVHFFRQRTHPNIAPVYECGSVDGVCFYSMPAIYEGNLNHRILNKMTHEEILRVAGDLALALDHLHSQGFLHRDIRPENVLFAVDGTSQLIDCLIARVQGSGRWLKEWDGDSILTIRTPHYMSPEQLQSGHVDGRADLYSLGAVLHKMLTGHAPYEAQNVFAVGWSHIHDPVPRLPAEAAGFQPLLDRTLAKSPEDRYATGAELCAACDAFLEGLADGQRHAGRTRNGGRGAKAAWRTVVQRVKRDASSFGHYRVLDLVSSGVFSGVYWARDERSERDVALNLLDSSVSGSAEKAAEVLGEAVQAWAVLEHPNIVPVYDHGFGSGRAFYTTALPRGLWGIEESVSLAADLGRELERRPDGVDPTRALTVVWGVARALAFAHDRGVLHGDVAPRNIFVVKSHFEEHIELTPWLADFRINGVKDRLATFTRNPLMFQDARYCAPEVRGSEDDSRDLYALGVVLYEMLVGRPPYEHPTYEFGERLARSWWLVASKPVDEPVPRLPARLADCQGLLDGLMAKSADDRHRSGWDVAAACEASLSSLGSQVEVRGYSGSVYFG